jgi:hypothetical protein
MQPSICAHEHQQRDAHSFSHLFTILTTSKFFPKPTLAMNPDVARGVALDVWRSRVRVLAQSIRAFNVASENPNLTLSSATRPSETSARPLPFEDLSKEMNNQLSKLYVLERYLHNGVTAVKVIRNQSMSLVPIHRLPNELLSEIFLTCLANDITARRGCRNALRRPLDLPDLVASVCSKWRKIALRTHRLWSFIDLRGQNQGVKTWLSCWISRSAQCPLDIRLSSTSFSHILNLLTPLFEAYPRWRTLALEQDHSHIDVSRMALSLLEKTAGRGKPNPQRTLETLEIICSSDHGEITSTRFLGALSERFPSLHTLHFHGRTEISTPAFLFPHLTNLHIQINHGISSTTLCSFLRACNRLEVLYFAQPSRIYTRNDTGIDPRLELVQLPNLRSVRLPYECGMPFYELLFRILRAPALEMVSIVTTSANSGHEGAIARGLSALESFFRYSGASIRYLELVGWSIPSANRTDNPGILETLLPLLPGLLQLTLEGRGESIPESIIGELTPTGHPRTQCLCPHLQSLRITGKVTCSVRTLADLVEARWLRISGAEALSSVSVKSETGMEVVKAIGGDPDHFDVALEDIKSRVQEYVKDLTWDFRVRNPNAGKPFLSVWTRCAC